MVQRKVGRIGVLGAGSWGTALSLLLAKKGHQITLWEWDPEKIEAVGRTGRSPFLPDLEIPDNVDFTNSIPEAVDGSDIVLFTVVSRGAKTAADALCGCLPAGIPIVSATKGLDGETGLTVSQMLSTALSERNPVAALSGPNLAVELSKDVPTATVAACADESVGRQVQSLFMSPTLRVYTNTDVIGVELAGALKNVIAIGAGICDGLGYGDNTKAALLTRGLAEITRLGMRLGARQATFMGLAGIGDLMATCASPLSRNRRVGLGLGQGRKLDEVLGDIGQAGMVAEGVPTTQAAYNLSQRLAVPMPITEQVYKVLFEDKDPLAAVTDLMSREPKDEVW